MYYLHYKYDAVGRLTDKKWEKLIDGKRTLWIEVKDRIFETDPEFVKALTGHTNNEAIPLKKFILAVIIHRKG